MSSPEISLEIKIPAAVHAFLKHQARQTNKTLEEYIDLVLAHDIAGSLILMIDEKPGLPNDPNELSVEMGLDDFIGPAKKWWADYDVKRHDSHLRG